MGLVNPFKLASPVGCTLVSRVCTVTYNSVRRVNESTGRRIVRFTLFTCHVGRVFRQSDYPIYSICSSARQLHQRTTAITLTFFSPAVAASSAAVSEHTHCIFCGGCVLSHCCTPSLLFHHLFCLIIFCIHIS